MVSGYWLAERSKTSAQVPAGSCRGARIPTVGEFAHGWWRFVRVEALSAHVFALDRLVHFLAVYGNLGRRLDAQPHLVTADVHHGDHDVVTDDDAFVALPRQNKHLAHSLHHAQERFEGGRQ